MHHMNKDNEICILNSGREYQDPHLKLQTNDSQ